RAALNAFLLTKVKIATMLVLVVGVLGMGAGALTQHVLAQRQTDAKAETLPPTKKNNGRHVPAIKAPPAEPDSNSPHEEKAIVVAGQVLDPDRRPVAGAKSGVLSYQELSWAEEASDEAFGLQFDTANDKGQFQLRVPRSSVKGLVPRYAFAAAPG